MNKDQLKLFHTYPQFGEFKEVKRIDKDNYNFRNCEHTSKFQIYALNQDEAVEFLIQTLQDISDHERICKEYGKYYTHFTGSIDIMRKKLKENPLKERSFGRGTV